MKSSQKKSKDLKTEKLSMKEAFDIAKRGSKTIVVDNGSGKNRSLREWLWNYPENISSFFTNTSPLSFIGIFLVIGAMLFFFLRSDSFANMFEKENSQVFVEGSVGAISTFNPIFATQNPVDKDIQSLVFEKFVNININGEPVEGIAKEWNVSKDNKVYDFTIDTSHKWQDGKSLTVDDIIFTFEISKKLFSENGYDTIGSSLQDVTVEKVSENQIKFTLKESNSTFFEAVSVYIVPEHILGSVSLSDIPFNSFSRYPLGSGPYKVYRSEPNVVYMSGSDNYPVQPKIETLIYRLYPDYKSMEAAFRNGVLDAIGGIDGGAMEFTTEYDGYVNYSMTVYSRIRMLFFNIRKDKLESKDIRIALDYITDKELLLKNSNILGTIEDGPIPPSSWAYNKDIVKYGYDPTKGEELFNAAGYVKNEANGYYESEDGKILSFTISYYDNEINRRLVGALKDMWKKEGVVLNQEPLSYTQLTQEILATRDYEILLYEIETTVDPDQYNLWHSLKSNYPDLNLSGYSYERVDILLEEARRSISRKERTEKYVLFQKYLTQDAPVMFLYHPKYVYIVSDNVKIPELGDIAYPFQRFAQIPLWGR
jgi:peptide/nickel transport system substrate-binding protein